MPDGYSFALDANASTQPRATITGRRLRRVTPLMERIERIVIRHALGQIAMPDNPTLGELAGGMKRQSVARALDHLHIVGRVVIERDGLKRRVIVAATGITTGWGPSRRGHAPFSLNPRGMFREKVKIRRPESRPIAAGMLDLRDKPWVAPILEPRTILTPPTMTCQWPLWGDDERPNGLYCGSPSTNRSLCDHHHALSYIPNKKRAAKAPKHG